MNIDFEDFEIVSTSFTLGDIVEALESRTENAEAGALNVIDKLDEEELLNAMNGAAWNIIYEAIDKAFPKED